MILDLQAYRRDRGMDGPPSPVEQVESQIYLLERVLQAAMVYRHVLDDLEAAEELFQVVKAAFYAGQLVAVVQGRALQNTRKALNPDPETGQDAPLVRLFQRLSR